VHAFLVQDYARNMGTVFEGPVRRIRFSRDGVGRPARCVATTLIGIALFAAGAPAARAQDWLLDAPGLRELAPADLAARPA